jgi:hypothetical protein
LEEILELIESAGLLPRDISIRPVMCKKRSVLGAHAVVVGPEFITAFSAATISEYGQSGNMGTISVVAGFLLLFSVVPSASKLFKLRYL